MICNNSKEESKHERSQSTKSHKSSMKNTQSSLELQNYLGNNYYWRNADTADFKPLPVNYKEVPVFENEEENFDKEVIFILTLSSKINIKKILSQIIFQHQNHLSMKRPKSAV
jgi:hypothetical protein